MRVHGAVRHVTDRCYVVSRRPPQTVTRLSSLYERIIIYNAVITAFACQHCTSNVSLCLSWMSLICFQNNGTVLQWKHCWARDRCLRLEVNNFALFKDYQLPFVRRCIWKINIKRVKFHNEIPSDSTEMSKHCFRGVFGASGACRMMQSDDEDEDRGDQWANDLDARRRRRLSHDGRTGLNRIIYTQRWCYVYPAKTAS